MKRKAVQQEEATYIDSHCHYEPSVGFPCFFKAISQSMQAQSDSSSINMAICLLDIEGTDWFSVLSSLPVDETIDVQQKDINTLQVTVGGDTITVFRGRQINSREKVEVIIMGCDKKIPSGLPLEVYIKNYAEDYLIILPWGVGKWLGRRGKLVCQMIEGNAVFVLGDNGGRPKWWTNISQFVLAHQLNIPILAGSDPLPIKNAYLRAGSYGNILDAKMDTCIAWISQVKNMKRTPPSYGQLSSTLSFFIEQIKLRFVKDSKQIVCQKQKKLARS